MWEIVLLLEGEVVVFVAGGGEMNLGCFSDTSLRYEHLNEFLFCKQLKP
jgi:hypothetical protein